MDLLQLPDECIQFIVNLLPVSAYKQYVLVSNWRPSDVDDNYLNRANVILSKPSIYPLYIQDNGEKTIFIYFYLIFAIYIFQIYIINPCATKSIVGGPFC